MQHTTTETARRIQREFLEMPGLRVTPAQARRLWNDDEHVCRTVLDVLVEMGFLRKTAGGTYQRTDLAA
jgi:hypothetical protein